MADQHNQDHPHEASRPTTPVGPSVSFANTSAAPSTDSSPSASYSNMDLTLGAGGGASSGFALPASNPFIDNQPLNPFSPHGTPLATPLATPLGSPTAEYRKLSLGVERYARAIEDPEPTGSFSGTVPLPSLSQSHSISSRRRPSNILMEALTNASSQAGHEGSSSSAFQEEAVRNTSGLNLSSIKRAISGKRRLQDITMADLESNNSNNSKELNDLGQKPGPDPNLQDPLLDSLVGSPQPLLLPNMTTMHPEAFNESRTAADNRRRLDQHFSGKHPGNHSPTPEDPAAAVGMRRRKPKGGILSQLLKLQRNEAAASRRAAATAATGPQHAAVKKTKKGFYYRSSSRNNSTADLHSPSVTTTPKVSPRNSRIFETDPSPSTRLPTQPSTSINNATSPFTKPSIHDQMEEMEAISAASAAATVAANLGIHRDIAEILTRQSFLIMIAKAMILYGAPSHRIEETCALLARKMDVDASFALLPGLMTISFSDAETHTSDTRHLRCTQGMDVYKLSKIYNIALGVLHGERIEAANKALEKVTIEAGYYPVWVTILAWMGAAAFVAPLAFNGSWLDTALAALCGLLVGLLGLVAAKIPPYGNVFEITSSILVGFIAKAFGERVCFSAVSLAGVVVLLPGLLLTQSIMELASRNIVSGAVRMFYALMYAFFLGFGISLGAELWDFVSGDSHVLSPDACKHGVDHWWFFLIFPLVSTSINIVFNAHPSQWFGMTLVTGIGFVVSYFMKSGPQITSAIAAFAVGVSGQLYGRVTGKMSYVPLLSGVLLQVPGSVGVRGVLAIIGSDPAQGFNFALSMVSVATSITLGVFCSALVWYPFWRKSTFMNF